MKEKIYVVFMVLCAILAICGGFSDNIVILTIGALPIALNAVFGIAYTVVDCFRS